MYRMLAPRIPTQLPRKMHPRKPMVAKALMAPDLQNMTYLVGKSLLLFTFFVSSLNYWYYRSIRETHEKDKSNNKN